jgi:hypothetical protein
MKITRFLLIVAALLTIEGSSQIYFAPGLGYGLPAVRSTLLLEYDGDSNSGTESGVFGSLGTGLMPQVVVGYNLSEYGGVELGFNYLVGSRITSNSQSIPSAGYSYITEEEMLTQGMRITAGGRLKCQVGKFSPYIRAAVIIGFGHKMVYNYSSTSTTPTTSVYSEYVQVFDGGLAIGFHSGFGFSIPLNDKLAFYAEGFFIGQSWAPTHSIYTTYISKGQDQLGQMSTYDKETNYVDEVNYNNAPTVTNEPRQVVKNYFPMSSAGLNAGIQFSLSR